MRQKSSNVRRNLLANHCCQAGLSMRIHRLSEIHVLFLVIFQSVCAHNAVAEDWAIGSVSLGIGYKLDIGGYMSGHVQHENVFGYNQILNLGFDITEEAQSYDVLLKSAKINNENPSVAYVLRHATADRQAHMGVDTVNTFFKPQAIFKDLDAQIKIEAIFGRDRVNNVSHAPAVLQSESGDRNVYGIGVAYAAQRADWSYDFGSEIINAGGDLTYSKFETATSYERSSLGSDINLGFRLAAGTIAILDGQTTVNDRFIPSSGVVRGFQLGGFGPSDASMLGGAAVGATNYATMSFDVRRRDVLASIPELAFGGFFDLGSAWNLDDNGDIQRAMIDDGAKLRASFGLTAGYNFGPAWIQLVLAEPIHHEETDRLQKLQINFSTKF